MRWEEGWHCLQRHFEKATGQDKADRGINLNAKFMRELADKLM